MLLAGLFRNRTSPSHGRESRETELRSRVTTAFRVMARGTDPAMAFARTKMFYRSLAGEWARSLT